MATLSRWSRPSGWRADLVALLAGGCLALGFPYFDLIIAVPVGLCILMRLIDLSPGPWVAARRGYWFGVGMFSVGLYWLTNAILVRADEYWWLVPFATPITALGLGPFTAIPVGLSRLAPRGVGRLFALAGLWTISDLGREFILTGFPWNLLGSVWEFRGVAGDVMIQPAALMSVHGLTLLTMLVGAAPAVGRRAMAGALAVLLAWAGFGAWRLSWQMPAPPGLIVVLTQGNVSESTKLGKQGPIDIFQRYLALTRQGVALAGSTPSVVAWPETASPFLVEGDQPALDAIANAMAPARAAFVGAPRYGSDGRGRNSMIGVLPGGTVGMVYDKAHLVPFGEYQPSVLPIQVVPGGGLGAGPGLATEHVAGVPPFSPLICYEVIFPGEVVRSGYRPDWILNITNDAWYGDSTGPRQHLEAARMRAVEEGLPLARAANTGVTAIFDARGHETGRLPFGRPGVLVRPLGAALPPTWFATGGLAIPIGLALVSLAVGFTRRGRAAAV
jgi:apolipoprotein N-acyltransferase